MSYLFENNFGQTGIHRRDFDDDRAINKLTTEAIGLVYQPSVSTSDLAFISTSAGLYRSSAANSTLPELSILNPSDRTSRLSELLKKLDSDEAIKYSQSGATKIGTRNGVPVYVKDSSGEWESKDGNTWSLKGTNRIWHGEVSIRDGNYHCKNTDSGVSAVQRPDGSATRSITDKSGQKIEVSTNEKGVAVRCVDATGTWTSADGISWKNEKSGATNNSSVRIDEFGQYCVKQNGTEKIEARSQELSEILSRQERLSRDYGVVFPKPGEKVTAYEKELTLRPPTNAELDCIERVLERNKHMDFDGMRLSFIQGSAKTDNESLWGVHRGGQNEILLYPKNNAQINGWTGLEGTLHHELVHHEQHKNWGAGNWTARSPEQVRQLLNDFGWTHDETSGNYRLLDKDNKQWQYNKDSGKWDPIIRGKVESGAGSISSTEMRDKAKVKPSTNYFNLPWEMHAEAQSMFRHDRHQLFEQNRDLYDLMKQYDQREINRRYGTNEDGQPQKIRGAEGKIVPNTPKNRRALEEMERLFSEVKAPPRPDLALHRGCCAACLAS